MAARRTTAGWAAALAAAATVLVAGATPAPAGAAGPYPQAVVLVSGFNTTSPFATPDPACDGKEGSVWNPPTGIAAALKARGLSVFTAPVRHLRDAPAAPCAPDTPVPPLADYVNSGGDIDANGAALGSFLAFLRDNYGVADVQLVAHSDGGNWSRAAITRSAAYTGVTIESLTTLGTPYSGSDLADLALELQGSKCDFSDRAERLLCRALQAIADLIAADEGETATRQLTRTFLAGWNRAQTIGRCPVTTIAGTHFDIPFFPFRYYDPSDGYVGEASALGRKSLDLALRPIPAPKIPNLRFGGTYPVVHAASLRFFDPNNLLNQQVISDKVASIVTAVPPGGPTCNAGAGPASPRAAGDQGVKAGPAAKRLRLRLPLRFLEAPSRVARLPKTKREDAIVLHPGTGLRCGRRAEARVPVLDDRRLRIVRGAGCRGRGALYARRNGDGLARALVLRSHPRNDVIVTVRGRKLKLRVRGPSVRNLRVTASTAGRKRALRIGLRGRAKLPRGSRHVTLRIAVTTQPGSRRANAAAVLAR